MEHVFFIDKATGKIQSRVTYDDQAPAELTAPEDMLAFRSKDPALAGVEPARLKATVENGEVTVIEVNPDYVPPDPPVPLEEQIADLGPQGPHRQEPPGEPA
jgi:hypothetical protein